ncbi:MAG: hypothetical protein HON32_03980 [Francisellaceae bacterium]|jgi:hypothetical protein|nr:hypothetical protein [Francisellaceae bacterium]MBT6538107.1 hypothetical protein [Francisellaceae bacterium]
MSEIKLETNELLTDNELENRLNLARVNGEKTKEIVFLSGQWSINESSSSQRYCHVTANEAETEGSRKKVKFSC